MKVKSVKTTIFASTICCTISLVQTVVAGTIHDVIVGQGGSFTFSPRDIEIELGDTIRWTWEGDGHNVASGFPGALTGVFFSGLPEDAGTVFEVVFDQALIDEFPAKNNLYDYHCQPHAIFDMFGSVQVLITTPCPWDLDNSGIVNTSDLLALFAQWGTAGPADFDGSGTVNTSDLLILFANWGPCP